LAFTATTGLTQPFLNASNSTIALGYGSYYAIAFRAFGAHSGPGTVSFNLNGTPYSQNVTFPDPTLASGVFASFTLPGGDKVTISATGLSADRIQVVPDGGGLVGDGTPDAFYAFNFTAGAQTIPTVPTPTLSEWALAVLAILLAGVAGLMLRRNSAHQR
jgi:hypothetical protein